MIRAIIITLTLICSLSCLADTGRFLRKTGEFTVSDLSPDKTGSISKLTISAAKNSDGKLWASIQWSSGDGTEEPLTGDGWFVYCESMSRVWVFDGERLSLLHHADKSLTVESLVKVNKTCPKEVQDALPESFRQKNLR